MLAHYVTWHMRQALAPMLFEDHDKQSAARGRPSPVASATVSASAKAKAASRKTADGRPVHSFRTLLQDLGALTRNTVRFGDAPAGYDARKANPASAGGLRKTESATGRAGSTSNPQVHLMPMGQ
jgi:hypothetical protein